MMDEVSRNPFENGSQQETQVSEESAVVVPLLELGQSATPTSPVATEEQRFDMRKFSLMASAAKITVFVAVVAIGITLVALLCFSSETKTQAIRVLAWVAELPTALSLILICLLYAASLLFFCPGTPFNLACGYMFGIYLGSVAAATGCMLGALVSFFAGRTVARDWVNKQMKKRPSFEALDHALGKSGLYIVFLTRLSPLFPFPLLNYAFGSTQVKLWQYAAGTFAGILPATIGYTYLGTLIYDIASVIEGDSTRSSRDWVILGVGAGLTVVSIVVISLITKRAIGRATQEFALRDSIERIKHENNVAGQSQM